MQQRNIHLRSKESAHSGMGCHDNSVPPRVPVSMLVSAKLSSAYLLSLLLASVFLFAGSESLGESQILLLLRADKQYII